MANRKKDVFDQIDEMFSEINGEQIVSEIIKGVDNVSSTINEALKNNGYDNVTEFYQGAIRDKKGKRPTPRTAFKQYTSRIAYIEDALSNINYEIKFRGYYREGHQEAVTNALKYLPNYQNNLDQLYKRIQQEANQTRTQMRNRKRDAYASGYLNGCEYVMKVLHQSKMFMMQQVLEEVKAY